ncbi:hypothetical protein RUM43_005135 [Polyplax serrata]|uniref:ferroxidase n=1 Tax=Polyplax serrata TaxID=468196 RepID=A0AAN8SF83_POLSC
MTVLFKFGFRTIDKLTFNNLCAETLDSLSEYFEELIESTPHLKNADVTYSDGVLTVYFGQKYGTYVINRQTPNLQIWLSSPISGPKRYDFLCGTWVYKHDKTTLHSLLDIEIREIANREVDFEEKCSHAKMKV